MHRRSVIAGGSAWVASGFATRSAGAAQDEDAKLQRTLASFHTERLALAPELATVLGLDVGGLAQLRGRLADYSAAGRERAIAAARSRLSRLRNVDRSKLSFDAQVDYDVVAYQDEQTVVGATRYSFGAPPGGTVSFFPYAPYSVSQLTGPYQSVPELLTTDQPVASSADAEAYLSRLAALASALDASTAQMLADARRGVAPPSFAQETTLAQLSALRAAPADRNGLVQALSDKTRAAGLDGGWATRAARIVEREVYPGVDRQREAVAELHGVATADAGVWKLPDGDAYYADALAFHTTLAISPHAAHAQGLRDTADLERRLDELLRRESLTQGSVGERIAALRKRPDQLFPNTDAGRDEMLAYCRGLVAQVGARLPAVFTDGEAPEIAVVRIPPEVERSRPNSASPPALDGSRPGRFNLNLADTGNSPRFTLPTLVYHETLPGHLWQGTLALRAPETPDFRKLTGYPAAYSEGWALYAEQLADEIGLYADDPIGRIGFLASLRFRAMRLVADTGLHAQRWDRDRAVQYMADGANASRFRLEVDRYCVWPGQACSYKLGHSEWIRLRDEMRARQGAQFNLRRFHDVLRYGRMPLQVLRRVVGEAS